MRIAGPVFKHITGTKNWIRFTLRSRNAVTTQWILYCIGNLGTGQLRLNYKINQVWHNIAWDRDSMGFYDLVVDLAIQQYQRISRDAWKRIAALEETRKNGYKQFTFASR